MTWRPTSTYRLQLHSAFPFQAAESIADYLAELGVGALYLSPILRAEKGSTHGYNLVDPGKLNPELGDEDGFRALVAAAKKGRMGVVVDFVPNHMGIASGENSFWNDVLENGPSSVFADFFDIDFHPAKHALRNKVLLPILGAQYGEALEGGDLVLVREEGAFFIKYYEHCLPVSPPSIAFLLEEAKKAMDASEPAADELASLVTALGHLPASHERAAERKAERAREKEVVKRRLAALMASSPRAASAIDEAVVRVNGKKQEPKSFDALDALLQEQCYRLSYWRVATEEINYRRFFDVNELAAIRMEDREVFEAMHGYFMHLVQQRLVDGIRLDHTDGLYDPAVYFEALQRRIREVRREDRPKETAYVLAEKILEPGERLPKGWAIEGTTGYDFLASVNGLWFDASAEKAMTQIYAGATGEPARFVEVAPDAKRAIMRSSLSAEVNLLAQALERLAQGRRRSRDFTLRSLTAAVVETVTAFPVYRTYIHADGSREKSDEDHVSRAIALAKRRNPDLSPTIFDFLEDMLLLRVRQEITDDQRQSQIRFAMRFQQLTGPMMAKGIEDTAFYRYNRLIALNEVGGHPARFGTSISAFHADNEARLASWPGSMLATSTHDTKRGEDTRARIAVLTEVPDEWTEHVKAWALLATTHESIVLDEPAPSLNDRYYFYQSAFGVFPWGPSHAEADLDVFAKRMGEHMAKATKEAKRNTRWLNPREDYDEAVQKFVAGMLHEARFVDSLRALVKRLGPYGASNGLSQAVLKLAAPGVPDVYQGSELWNLSLCDPDNRLPVDYDAYRRILRDVSGVPTAKKVSEWLGRFEDGTIKMHVSRTLLRMRASTPELFGEGSYAALEGGPHVVAFTREHGRERVVVVATRLARTLTNGAMRWAVGDAWKDARLGLPEGTFVDRLTGEEVPGGEAALAKIFSVLPVAVLTDKT